MPRRANAANLPSKRRKKDADCTDKYLRYGEDPNKSWKPCKWKLTFDAPQPSTTFQEASKEDSRLAGWEIGKRRPAEYFPLMYDQHGYPVRCVECGMKWKTGKTSRKRHNDKGFVLDSNGKKVAICVIARQNEEKAQQKRNSAKRLKSNATQSAAKQPLQPSNVTPVSGRASQPASVPASGPVPEPAVEQQVQLSNVVLASDQSQADLVGSGCDALQCDNDDESSASGTTNLIRANNVHDFEDAFRNLAEAEPLTKPPTQPLDQPTKPGLRPEESANAEMSPPTDAIGDLTHMGLGNNDQATLTPAEQADILNLVNDVLCNNPSIYER